MVHPSSCSLGRGCCKAVPGWIRPPHLPFWVPLMGLMGVSNLSVVVLVLLPPVRVPWWWVRSWLRSFSPWSCHHPQCIPPWRAGGWGWCWECLAEEVQLDLSERFCGGVEWGVWMDFWSFEGHLVPSREGNGLEKLQNWENSQIHEILFLFLHNTTFRLWYGFFRCWINNGQFYKTFLQILLRDTCGVSPHPWLGGFDWCSSPW